MIEIDVHGAALTDDPERVASRPPVNRHEDPQRHLRRAADPTELAGESMDEPPLKIGQGHPSQRGEQREWMRQDVCDDGVLVLGRLAIRPSRARHRIEVSHRTDGRAQMLGAPHSGLEQELVHRTQEDAARSGKVLQHPGRRRGRGHGFLDQEVTTFFEHARGEWNARGGGRAQVEDSYRRLRQGRIELGSGPAASMTRREPPGTGKLSVDHDGQARARSDRGRGVPGPHQSRANHGSLQSTHDLHIRGPVSPCYRLCHKIPVPCDASEAIQRSGQTR